MDLYTLLSSKLDLRKEGYDCTFNGYLEDYVELIEEEKVKNFFSVALNINNDFHIISDVRFKANTDSVSNLIIRYKDINKLGNKAIIVPYILYTKDKAIIVHEEYLYAKAIYFALTENDSALVESRNSIIAVSFEDDLKNILDKFDLKQTSRLQREIDAKHFKSYEEAYNRAIELSKEIENNYIENTRNSKQKEKYIFSCVSRWFLLKKFVYVSYMIDKNILKEKHNNNVKDQRSKAKEYTDSIRYVAMSKMWEEVKKKSDLKKNMVNR